MNRGCLLRRWARSLVLTGAAAGLVAAQPAEPRRSFQVQLYEGVSTEQFQSNSFNDQRPAMTWESPFLGVLGVPGKVSPSGFTMTREQPFVVSMKGETSIEGGRHLFQLRSASHARLFLDGKLILSSEPPKPRKLSVQEIAAEQAEENRQKEAAAKEDARRQLQEQVSGRRLEDPSLEFNESVLKAVQEELIKNKRTLGLEKSDAEPPKPLQTKSAELEIPSGRHTLRLECNAIDSNIEVSVAMRSGNRPMSLLSLGPIVRFSEKGWADWQDFEKKRIQSVSAAARSPLQQRWEAMWKARHQSLTKPPLDSGKTIDTYLNARLTREGVDPAPLAGDYEFARRIYLDAWGLIPTADQVRDFVNDKRSDKRARLIQSLVADAKWADPWVAYWEDALAENPKTFGRVANSSGPFKRWIHKTFVEDRGYDRFATELILMEGTDDEEGTLGFSESLENDVPMAEKAFVISQAFMAANMKCARCHDSPLNKFKQRDLFGIAAMLAGKPVRIPETSSVGAVPGRRPPAVRVTTKPGEFVHASFVFDADRQLDATTAGGRTVREQLAAGLTSQRRFAEVGVNRIWQRFLGTGLVESVDDWPANPRVADPELLTFLTDEFIGSGYSVRHIEELILRSDAYQRVRNPALAARRAASGELLFAAQPARRMRAEEIVDSLHLAVRRNFKTERMAYAAVDYGYPQRLWQVVTLSNEEDNAILARPLLQEIISAGSSFGWRDQRPDPKSVRSNEANALQPLTMANGALVSRLVRLTDAAYYTKLALSQNSLHEFTEELFLNTLSRVPSQSEQLWLTQRLEPVWQSRRVPVNAAEGQAPKEMPIAAARDMLDAYRYLAEARRAEAPARQLTDEFRKSVENVIWVLFNTPEFVFVP